MKYVLEIYYEGKCIERREYQEPFISPIAEEEIYVEFENYNYISEYGNWWKVKTRKHLLSASNLKMQTIQLFCEPCPDRKPSTENSADWIDHL
jgi:hypothetical protein